MVGGEAGSARARQVGRGGAGAAHGVSKPGALPGGARLLQGDQAAASSHISLKHNT